MPALKDHHLENSERMQARAAAEQAAGGSCSGAPATGAPTAAGMPRTPQQAIQQALLAMMPAQRQALFEQAQHSLDTGW